MHGPDLPEVWVRKIVEVSHAHGLKVTAHSYGEEGDWAAIRGGVDGIEHLVNVPHALSGEIVAAIRERDIVVCPTRAGSSYSVVRFLRAPELLYEDRGLVAHVSAGERRKLYFALRLLKFPGVARVLMRTDRPLEKWESWYLHSLANTAALYKAVPMIFGTESLSCPNLPVADTKAGAPRVAPRNIAMPAPQATAAAWRPSGTGRRRRANMH